MAEKTKVARKQVVSLNDFIQTFMKVYKDEGTVADVAEALDMNPRSVSLRALNLRKKGVNLPRLNRTVSTIDVDAVNSYIQQLSE